MRFIWPIIIFLIFVIPFVSCVLTPFLYYVIWGSLLVFLLAAFILKRRLPPSKNIAISALSFLAYLIIPVIFSKTPMQSLRYFFHFCVCIFAFLVFSRIDTKKKRLLSSIIILSSFFIALFAIYQHCIGFGDILKAIAENKVIIPERDKGYFLAALKGGKAVATFTTANLLSGYLAMVSLIILGYMLDIPFAKRFFLLLPVLFINLCALYFTYRVAGAFSLCFGFIIFISLCLLKSPATIERYKSALIPTVILITIITTAILVLRGSDLYRSEHLQSLQMTFNHRLIAWRFLTAKLTANPFQFLGLGNYRFISFDFNSCPGGMHSIFVHNLFLQLWIEAGIAGLAIFIWFIVSLLIRGLHNLRKAKAGYFLDIGLISAVLAFLLSEMAGYAFFIGQASITWWALCGLLAAES